MPDNDMSPCKVCGKPSCVLWPLIEGEPALCKEHYDNPTEEYRELVEAANAPPDDFDIPY